ncbi:MAG: cryptochrome/photolyase family protein [Acidimicrobiales bacterium]|nr:cryptochrome/photolyase family protein [Acidimicrobiales bacterium]
MDTVWVLGDQLDRGVGPLATARPGRTRVLIVESAAKLRSKTWHRQRLHLVLTAMRRFAAELRTEGFEVDHRRSASLADGLAAHAAEHRPGRVVAMAPASASGRSLLRRLGVEQSPNAQFLCSEAEFSTWADARRGKRLVMEDFYRWRRRTLGYLMDGTDPCGGRWNFDQDNRKPPPRAAVVWPAPLRSELDELDAEVLADLAELEAGGVRLGGAIPDGTWATSRAEALRRLDHAVSRVLPRFGPHEDAMLSDSWHLAHTLLSPYLNLGLLRPGEVCDAAEAAYRSGRVPIASAEGFIRQIIGWREYVWGVYWREIDRGYRAVNALGAHRPLPPAFTVEPAPGGTGATGPAADPQATTGFGTEMRCLGHVRRDIYRYGWTHHIQRLMILGNLALLAGVQPQALSEWMWANFVDGAEWVMLPNVLGMATYADGGLMATKPYAAGGAYIDRLSDYCQGCRYDRRRRVGPDACPFTVLYWAFLARHAERFAGNARLVRQVRAAEQLADLDEVCRGADGLLERLDRGAL